MHFENNIDGTTWTDPVHSRYASEQSAYAKARDAKNLASHEPIQHTTSPIVTGASVIGIKYKGGVMIAADTLASYGRMARFDNVSRLQSAGTHTCVGVSGDLSDFQELQHIINSFVRDESNAADSSLRPSTVHEWLSKVMYRRRSDINPYWNDIIVGGVEITQLNPEGEPFLAYVDKFGITYKAPSIATGFGNHLALPIMRSELEQHPEGLDEAAAKRVMESCMQVLFYRDCLALNKFQIATITKAGVNVYAPQSVHTEWSFAEKIEGY